MNVTPMPDGTQLQYIKVSHHLGDRWLCSEKSLLMTAQPLHALAMLPSDALRVNNNLIKAGYQGLSVVNAIPLLAAALPSARVLYCAAEVVYSSRDEHKTRRFDDLVGMTPDRYIAETDCGHGRTLAERLSARYSRSGTHTRNLQQLNDFVEYVCGDQIEHRRLPAKQSDLETARVAEVLDRENGSQVRIIAEATFDAAMHRAITVCVQKRQSPEHDWVLCDEKENAQSASVTDCSALLLAASKEEIFQTVDLIGRPLAEVNRPCVELDAQCGNFVPSDLPLARPRM